MMLGDLLAGSLNLFLQYLLTIICSTRDGASNVIEKYIKISLIWQRGLHVNVLTCAWLM